MYKQQSVNIFMCLSVHLYITGGARIIERSQEYKSTVKYRTFVLLRVPIPRGVGKFNYRTGIHSIIKFPRSIIKSAPSGVYLDDTAGLLCFAPLVIFDLYMVREFFMKFSGFLHLRNRPSSLSFARTTLMNPLKWSYQSFCLTKF